MDFRFPPAALYRARLHLGAACITPRQIARLQHTQHKTITVLQVLCAVLCGLSPRATQHPAMGEARGGDNNRLIFDHGQNLLAAFVTQKKKRENAQTEHRTCHKAHIQASHVGRHTAYGSLYFLEWMRFLPSNNISSRRFPPQRHPPYETSASKLSYRQREDISPIRPASSKISTLL